MEHRFEKPIEKDRESSYGSNFLVCRSRKLSRRITAFSYIVFDGLMTLEMNPGVSWYCERPLTAQLLLKTYLEKCISKNVYYTIANNDLFQIMSSRATKWNGIETVLNAYGIDARDIMYFGDNYDDIEPIMRSGFGVVVSNAIEEVKEIADCIIDSNENDGMAKYINETVLAD